MADIYRERVGESESVASKVRVRAHGRVTEKESDRVVV